ncbi:MAG: F0F1 ATP synthase subunit delta [Anaerolineae bacterium]
MANDELARNYAQAIFEKAVERWQKPLRAVNAALQAQPDTLLQLDNPAENYERKKDQANRLLPRDADAEVRNFIYLLTSKNELHLLPEIAAAFDRFATRGPNRELARVTSAIEIQPDERAKLESKLRAQFGSDLDFEYRVDRDLLGGVVVRVGDRIFDGSVSGKLAAMRQKLETAR